MSAWWAFLIGLVLGIVVGPVLIYLWLAWLLARDEPPIEWGGGPYG